MKTRKELLFPALFLLALLLTPALTMLKLMHSPSDWSVEENRALASAPQLSAQSIWDGTLAQDAEAYYKDHIAARRLMLKLDTAIQMQVLRRAAVHDVVVGDIVLLPAPGLSARLTDGDLEQKAQTIAEGLQSVRQAADEVGARLLYTLVPEQRTVFAGFFPDWMDNPGRQTMRNRRALLAALERAEIPTLDLTPVFAQRGDLLSCYSRVDHHYTLKGAYVTYQSVCEAFGLRASEISIAETESDLLGTYNRKLYDLSPVREAMQVVQTPFPAYERLDNGAASETPLVRVRESGQSLYGDYMGGDIAETIVRTNRPALPRILIVGDSFTNALDPLAVFDFDEMRGLDYRHFDGPALSDYIRAYQPDYVLILRDDVSCLGADGNGALQ